MLVALSSAELRDSYNVSFHDVVGVPVGLVTKRRYRKKIKCVNESPLK